MTSGTDTRRRGRPPRTSAPFIIRGTVPDNHPLYATLREMGPARAAMLLLEIAANRFTATGAAAAVSGPSSLGLNSDPVPAHSISETTTPATLEFGSDVADLLNF